MTCAAIPKTQPGTFFKHFLNNTLNLGALTFGPQGAPSMVLWRSFSHKVLGKTFSDRFNLLINLCRTFLFIGFMGKTEQFWIPNKVWFLYNLLGTLFFGYGKTKLLHLGLFAYLRLCLFAMKVWEFLGLWNVLTMCLTREALKNILESSCLVVLTFP